MGDRLAILDGGQLQQTGRPKDVYQNPRNEFVGGFVGSPSMNFMNLDVSVGSDGDTVTLTGDDGFAYTLRGDHCPTGRRQRRPVGPPRRPAPRTSPSGRPNPARTAAEPARTRTRRSSRSSNPSAATTTSTWTWEAKSSSPGSPPTSNPPGATPSRSPSTRRQSTSSTPKPAIRCCTRREEERDAVAAA